MSLTRRVFLERIAQIGGYSAVFRTMQVLGLTPAASGSNLPQLAADFGRGKSVVILGAGIAGLVSTAPFSRQGAALAAATGQCVMAPRSNLPTEPSRAVAGL
jgi:monoamine oxidase